MDKEKIKPLFSITKVMKEYSKEEDTNTLSLKLLPSFPYNIKFNPDHYRNPEHEDHKP